MVRPPKAALLAVVGSSFVVMACPDPDEELCDEPSGGDDEVGAAAARSPSEAVDSLGLVRSEAELNASNLRTRSADFRSWGVVDPRTPVSNEDDLQSYPLRTVVNVQLSYEAHPGVVVTANGSGFLAGPRHVVTNRHVASVTGDTDEIDDWLEDLPAFFYFDVFPGRSNTAVLNGGAWAVERVIWNPHPANSYNDYALLILEDDVERSGQYGRMGVCSASNGTLGGLSVFTAGYPGANNACDHTPEPPSEDNECPCGGWMYFQSCVVAEADPQELFVDCATQKGQSGSPLWVDRCASGTRCSVGVIYGKKGLETAAVRWEDEDVDWLQSNICAWPSTHAPMPQFCS